MQLRNEDYEKIQELCSCGDNFVKNHFYDEAISKYKEALDLVPDDKAEWEASTWIYTALGDTYFFKRDFESAKNYLYDALNCPQGISNPFISFRLGQCLAELGDIEKSKRYLLRTYMIDGEKIFRNEDIKYFNIISKEI